MLSYMHIYMHTTYRHVCIHTYLYIHIDSRVCVHALIHVYIHTWKLMHTSYRQKLMVF